MKKDERKNELNDDENIEKKIDEKNKESEKSEDKEDKKKKLFNKKTGKIALALVIILLLNITYRIIEANNPNKPTEISYNAFVKKMDKKQIETVYYYSKADTTVECIDKKGKHYEFTNPSTDEFKVTLLEHGIEIKTPSKIKKETIVAKIKSTISTIYPIAIVIFFYAAMKEQVDALVTSNKAVEDSEKPKVKFDDIVGLTKTKKELGFIVEFMKDPSKFENKGVKMPSGILLYGPPGTGKTMMAKAIAGEANVPFYYKSGSDFVELYAGNGARKVRSLFKEAKENAPCIIFIDEIDALGMKRAGDNNNQEANQTINAFLAEIDGFSGSEGVLVIGATNMIDKLDQAFVRPGRFDKHICIPLPDSKEERFELFKLYSKGKELAEDVNLEELAKKSVWFSGADIEALMNDAALKSFMDNEDKQKGIISKKNIDDAFYEKLTKGHKKDRTESEKRREVKITAWHEAGHAIVTRLLANDEVVTITIAGSTSGVGGFTQPIPTNQTLKAKKELLNEISYLYGGRAAEELLFGNKNDVTTGASNDIKEATNRIKELVSEYGMTEKYGMLNLDSMEMIDKKDIIDEMKRISDECYETALSVLSDNIDILRATANTLIEKETINGEKLDEIIEKNKR